VRVGLFGFGRVGAEVHLPVLRGLPGIASVAVAEPDASRRALAERAGVRVTDDPDELLSDGQTDAIVIAAPPALHTPLALAALARGRHLYMEKPLATVLADGEQIVEAWKACGGVGMMGFNYRFNPLVLEARQWMVEGRVGAPTAVRSVFSTAARSEPCWRRSPAAGGGALFDLGSHHIDLVTFLVGRPMRRARLVEDHAGARATLHLELEGDVTVDSSFALGAGDVDRVEIDGEHGTIVIDRYQEYRVKLLNSRTRSWVDRLGQAGSVARGGGYLLEKLRSPWHEPSFRRAMQHFVDAVRGRRQASPDLSDGLRCLQIVVAACRR
jgi:predicted dehydrogenase